MVQEPGWSCGFTALRMERRVFPSLPPRSHTTLGHSKRALVPIGRSQLATIGMLDVRFAVENQVPTLHPFVQTWTMRVRPQ